MASNKSKEVKFAIKITNFINPHLFHFKLESSVGKFDIDVETNLQLNAAELLKQGETSYEPQSGEIVAAYIRHWKKWCRAQVDLILEEGKEKKYVVWCMDHGVPMKMTTQNLLPIPIALRCLPATVYTGGLAKCEPIEKRWNFGTMQPESFGISDFPEYLIAKAKQLIDEAAEICFLPYERIGSHIFGDLRITKHTGKKTDLLRELARETENVQIGQFNIPRDIDDKFTIKKRRYENHLGRLNVQESMKLFAAADMTKCAATSDVTVPSSKHLEDEDKVILDWIRQNRELANTEEENKKNYFNKVVYALEDFKVLDSAHIPKYPRSYKYGSSSSMSMSSMLESSQFGSYSTINEDEQSEMEPDFEKRQIKRLEQQMSAHSITTVNSNIPPKKKETKKIVYIPSGHESDLVNFHKYNINF